MRTLLRTPLFGAILWIGLAGCQTAPAGPNSAPPEVPAAGAVLISSGDAAAGRALYMNKCARCHKFFDPAKYSQAEWNKWMTSMSRKSRLTPAQRDLMEDYLGAFRAPATNKVASPAQSR